MRAPDGSGMEIGTGLSQVGSVVSSESARASTKAAVRASESLETAGELGLGSAERSILSAAAAGAAHTVPTPWCFGNIPDQSAPH